MTPQLIQLACILEGLEIALQQGSASKAADKGKPEETFSQLLDQTLGSCKGSLSPNALQARKTWDSAKAVDSHNALGASERGGTERGWLELFRNQLLSGGISLKDLSLSPKAMPSLKKLLLAEGFSESDVKHFLEGVFGGHGRREVKIPELLEKLSKLKALSDKKSRGPALEVSVVPHMETLLRFLGLDVEQAENVISKSRVDGGGLSLKSLIKNLKVVMDKLPDEPTVGRQSVEDVRTMLACIGMVDEAVKVNGPVSLEQFVQIMEKKVAGLMPHHLSKDEGENCVRALLGHVLVAPEEQRPKSSSQRHYSHKLKGLPHDQLKGNQAARADKQTAEGWKEAAPYARKAPTGAEAFADLQSNKDELFLNKTQKPVEAVRWRASEKMPDQKHGAAAHTGKEAIIGRAPVSETVAKQAARPIPLHVIDQVGRRLGLALKRGDNQVRIQLRPPSLGSIQLEMALNDNALKVTVRAEHQSVKEILMSHVHELRKALAEHGVELQKIDVEISHYFGQSMANTQRDLNGPQSGRRGLTSAPGVAENRPECAEEIRPVHIRSDALVDMFA